jgi:hypothetical protein
MVSAKSSLVNDLVENHRSLFQCFGEENLNSLPPSAASTVKSGAASPGFNAAHAAVAQMPRQRVRNRIDGFTRRILLFCARLAVILPIKSTLTDRKIAAFGFSAASLLAHSGTATEGRLGVIRVVSAISAASPLIPQLRM